MQRGGDRFEPGRVHPFSMTTNLQQNIWKYTLLLVANKRVYIAILGSYYLTIPGVTPKTIGLTLLAGSLSGFLFEIPSGYISDKIGHKHALVISRLSVLVSTLFFLFAESITFLIFGSIFLSVGLAFHSGTGSAFMHETLRALKREHDYTRIMGKISAIGFAVPIILTTLIPFLVSVSYKTPFLIALIIDLIGLLTVLSLTTPAVSPEEIKEIGVTNFKSVLKEGYKLNYFSIALFSGIVSASLFSIGGFRAAYQDFLLIPVIWYGVFFGAGRALASLMLAYSGKIKDYITLPILFRFQIITYTLLILLLGAVTISWVVVLVFIIINAFQWGLTKIDGGYHLDIIKSSKFKATLLSTAAQIEQIIAAIFGFGIGFMIEHISYQAGFFYFGLIFLIILAPLYFYISHRYKAGFYDGR